MPLIHLYNKTINNTYDLYRSRKNGEIRSQQYTFKTEKPGADPKTDRDRTMQFQDRVIVENGTCQDDRHLYRE